METILIALLVFWILYEDDQRKTCSRKQKKTNALTQHKKTKTSTSAKLSRCIGDICLNIVAFMITIVVFGSILALATACGYIAYAAWPDNIVFLILGILGVIFFVAMAGVWVFLPISDDEDDDAGVNESEESKSTAK